MASVVAALAVVGIGASTASANSGGTSLGTCNGTAYSSAEALLACLVRLSNPGDFEPIDTKVAAPSSVIAATAPDDPELKVKSVNRWRPNTQAWIDAKARIAATSGLTTEDILQTARWNPVILKGAKLAVGGASVLAGDTVLTWAIRDGVVYPILEEMIGLDDARGIVRDTYCQRYGNVASDWVAGWVGASCGDWRLNQDYAALVGETGYVGTAAMCVDGRCSTFLGFTTLTTQTRAQACVTGYDGDTISFPGRGYYAVLSYQNGSVSSNQGLILPRSKSSLAPYGVCKGGGTLNNLYGMVEGAHYTGITITDLATGADVTSQFVDEVSQDSEWITRVRCLDGTTRAAVSDSFQQQKLGGVAVPRSVALAGCQPVGVDTGLQVAGTGTTGAGGGWSSTPGGNRVATQASDVSTAVNDWMEAYPQCMDGSCLLELKKEIGGTMELDCFAAPEQCADWQTETAAQTAVYRCYYANAVVDLAECNVYGRTFQRQNVQTGTAYSDPATGETVKTGTGTTTTTNPGAQTISMSSPVADPATTRTCWPTGWGIFNPFEWVYQPVKCALEWAFVPRTSKITQVQTALRLAVMDSTIGEVATVANTWKAVAAASNPSGCSGPTISLDLMGIMYSGNPLSACAEPAATLAFWSRVIIGIAVTLAAVFAVTRYIGRVIGFEGFGRSSGGDS